MFRKMSMWCCSNLEAPDPPSDIHLPIGSFGGQRGIALQKSPKKKTKHWEKNKKHVLTFWLRLCPLRLSKSENPKIATSSPSPAWLAAPYHYVQTLAHHWTHWSHCTQKSKKKRRGPQQIQGQWCWSTLDDTRNLQGYTRTCKTYLWLESARISDQCIGHSWKLILASTV